MQEGYIKLHRCILDSSWSRQSDFVAVWVYCLLRANYAAADVVTKGGSVVRLEPGQFITSREQISLHTGVQESKVERILKVFKSEQQVEQIGMGKFRVISIVNWAKYQGGEQQNEQHLNNKRTTDEQQMNTNKKVKKEKKNKEEKELKPLRGDAAQLFPTCAAWRAFKEMRKAIKKPLTPYAEILVVKKLATFHAKGHDPTHVLNTATENCWQGIYEPKEAQGGRSGASGSTTQVGRKEGSSRDKQKPGDFSDDLSQDFFAG